MSDDEYLLFVIRFLCVVGVFLVLAFMWAYWVHDTGCRERWSAPGFSMRYTLTAGCLVKTPSSSVYVPESAIHFVEAR